MPSRTAAKTAVRHASDSVDDVRTTARSDAPLADVGVPSPYALAGLIARRTIDWATVPNRPAVLEDIFQTPYADLFDPANGSPLYVGQSLQADGTVRRRRPELARPADGRTSVDSDAAVDDARDLSGVTTLADLVKRLGGAPLEQIPVRGALTRSNSVMVELGETVAARRVRFGRLFDKGLLDVLFPHRLGYHPEGFSWQDMGRFYNEATEFLDPVQGFVGDCYFIAAMSSVAWSLPYVVADRTRATGMDNDSFVHQIGFHGNHGLEQVEVTDRILVNSGSSPEYAHSKEAGEIWPAVYEKAYAKWRLGEPTDYPAIPNIAGGDPSIACVALTGLRDYRNWHSSFSAAEILQTIKDHSASGRTTTPMVSWTYGSGDLADVAYRDANVVAGHAYSVLGWMRRYEFVAIDQLPVPVLPPVPVPVDWPVPGPDPGPRTVGHGLEPATRLSRGTYAAQLDLGLARWRVQPVDYVVLRNPWGFSEGSGPTVAAGSHTARDVDWWHSIPLGADGVFAMEINAYHRYFAGTGGAH